ncbi:MAG: cobalt-precorrin-5B (C(1))-methyltransferase CbiD [Ruminococcus sp.]|nr:cobalt-precorrin-5B (C(1))-methyltransferase CbiD [Ruminococcus sp.]
MFEEYVYKGKQKLRCGYTTGSCAAGASKAAAEMLLTGKIVCSTEIMTPKGIKLNLEISGQKISDGSALCCVVKDSGDDPDITNGIKVFSEVSLTEKGIEISGGEGIGKVTKEGLDQPVGEWAINSVPRKMIKSALKETAEFYEYYGGFKVVIFVPNGAEIAKKTYNSRIGIIGGISIIGTNGIVEPMSNTALIETIRTEAKVRRLAGDRNMLLTLGNYSDSFVQSEMPFSLERSIKCSNFIGEAVDIGLETGFESILILGHIGKMVKLGAGIMNTHSANADGRMDVLVTCGVLAGVETDILKKIPSCVTVDAALDILRRAGVMEKVLQILAERVDYYLSAKVKNEIKTAAVIFSYKHSITIKTKHADTLIKAISEE